MILLYYLIFFFYLLLIVCPQGKLISDFLRLSIKTEYKIFLSVIFGLILVTLESYLAGFIGGIKYIEFLHLFVSGICWIYIIKIKKINPKKFSFKPNFLIFTLIASIVILNSLITFPFGVIRDKGISLGGAHNVDNTWHLALINSLEKDLPAENPNFAGMPLKNYHYFVDLQIASIHQAIRIPLPELFFRIYSSFLIFLLCWICFILGKELTGRSSGGIIFLLLVTFSSNWYYLANLFYKSASASPSIAWIDFFSSKSVNYPLLFSLIVMLTIFYLLFRIKKYNIFSILTVGVLMGVLMPIKSHTALVLLLSFGGMSLLLALGRNFDYLKIVFVGGLIGFVFLFLTIKPGQESLLFSPFWFIRVMYEASDRLNNPDWELRRQYLLSIGAYLGVIKLYMEGVIVFLLVNLNLLLLGLLIFTKKLSANENVVFKLAALVVFVSFWLTMLFIYQGTAIVTIQFFYPAIVLLSLLFTVFVFKFFSNKKYLPLILCLILWVSFLPGVFVTLKSYLHDSSQIYVSKQIVMGLDFLSSQEEGRVLVSPFYFESSVVPAYSAKISYLSAKNVILESLMIDYKDREKQVNDFFDCSDEEGSSKLIIKSDIKYIFSDISEKCLKENSNFRKIYDNSQIVVYKIN